MRKFLYYSLCLFFCTACAGLPPKPLQIDLASNPSLTQVKTDIKSHIGQQVRWGGTLQSVHNLANDTELEIIARPLTDSARPNIYGNSPGRFIADVQGFLDPSDFRPGREVTVIGTIKDISTRKIGEYSYRFPVITATTFYLWPQRIEYQQPVNGRYAYPPYWVDPWYGWYPWYPWWYY